MITEQQARSMLHHPVHDAEGNKIGKADHMFLDDVTGKPEWVSVKTGWFGASESFVPIRDARVVGDHLEVPYPKEKVKDAPLVDVDSSGHLSKIEERRLREHYGIAWDEAWKSANQPGEGGWAHRDAGAAGKTGTTGLTGTAAAAGATTGATTRAAATPGATASATGRTGLHRGQSDTMTRSEERMSVGVERYETGHAKLHKYVVTEEERQTVPVRHEEVHIEREPINEADRRAMSGDPIAEAEYEVTLHAERPVVRTEAVPVERVRLVTEERVEEQTVTGRLRKERIEAELPDGKTGQLRGKEFRGTEGRR
ncbi:PRC and DUF2382 domain-containing protein [Kitasatospora brasiliensis]|uniref:PRC and DUF2382 domain-containing protein n=1 Tax=Kitasatospora brasiliensis TaxID=3058040 RepID=UPI00292D143A|nr:PRC and DUF2382 domain-containing protein [Kitasatospora sp. K002]